MTDGFETQDYSHYLKSILSSGEVFKNARKEGVELFSSYEDLKVQCENFADYKAGLKYKYYAIAYRDILQILTRKTVLNYYTFNNLSDDERQELTPHEPKFTCFKSIVSEKEKKDFKRAELKEIFSPFIEQLGKGINVPESEEVENEENSEKR